MTLESCYLEKGLAVTQIELWQQRLKAANESIIKMMNENEKNNKIENIIKEDQVCESPKPVA